MAKKIRLKNIEEATRMTRKLISFSAMGVIFKPQWAISIYFFFISFVPSCQLLYSLYYYRKHIEKVAIIAHHVVLTLDIFNNVFCGIIWKNYYDNMFDEPYWTYDYESKLMLKKQTEIKEECAKNMYSMMKYSVYGIIFAFMDFVLFAISESYMNGDTRPLLFPCWFPFQLDYIPVYLVALLWEALITVHFISMVYATLLISHYFYSHIKSELLLLGYSIETINERAYEMAKNHPEYRENEKCILNYLILKQSYIKSTAMCAQHHADIIRYFHSGMIPMDYMYFLVFISGLLVCTFTGFALISDNTALKVKFLVIMGIQLVYLYMMCWAGEAIKEESLVISDTIYALDWIFLPRECHRLLMIMMIRSTKPLQMKLTTGQEIDLALYMSLVKTSYSYFNMMLVATTQ